jgi:hypothetical protein
LKTSIKLIFHVFFKELLHAADTAQGLKGRVLKK